MGVDGRVAIVTGSTGGIGRAIANRLSHGGAHLILAGQRENTDPPRGAVQAAGDITDETYVAGLVDMAKRYFGGLDILVNCHGLDFHSQLPSTSVKEARRLLEVNVMGVVITMKHAIPAMVDRGGGSIVNIGSRLGQVAIPGQAVYGASKAAVAQLTRGAAIDWAREGVRVNCVAPGLTETEMISSWVGRQSDPEGFRSRLLADVPMGRMATPDEVAAAVVFLAGDEASHITGVTLPVDGGYTAR
jgi:NAD(P)-dependent dehydrogenase (short-subunit alcohol dehydrogenase family)